MSTIIISLFAIIGITLGIIPNVIWNKKYGKKYIDANKLPLRKKYRLCSSFGFLLFIASILTIAETEGLIKDSYITLIIFPMLMSQNKILFEPYHTSEVADKLENFCLYLRPFNLSHKDKGYYAHGNTLIPESLEKLFCNEINKRIAKTYCIGDPNTAIPTTLCSSGIYASDEEWKTTVDNMAKKCKLILMRIMDTDGCKWELKHCIDRHLEKTIFLISCDNHLDLLKEYIGDNIAIPNISFQNNNCLALYLDKQQDKWIIAILKSIRDIKSAIKKFIKSHPQIRTEIEQNNKFFTILQAPFKEKGVKAKLSHYFSFFQQPFWYILYNNWPKWWILIFTTYFIAITLCAISIIIYNKSYIIPLALLSFLPWVWLAPRISQAFNSWGSKYLCTEGNKTLCRWVITFILLVIGIGLIPEITQPKEYQAQNFAEDILTIDFGYLEYSPIHTSVDSSFSSIYTDEQVRTNICELYTSLYSENTTEDTLVLLLDKFYESISNVNDSIFEGWSITHKFSYIDELGNYNESLCLILTDEDFEQYFVYSLDDNERHPNYYEIKETIDELLSE